MHTIIIVLLGTLYLTPGDHKTYGSKFDMVTTFSFNSLASSQTIWPLSATKKSHIIAPLGNIPYIGCDCQYCLGKTDIDLKPSVVSMPQAAIVTLVFQHMRQIFHFQT